jgi:hypothetical protein
MCKFKQRFKSKGKGNVHLAHLCCVSDCGPHLVVDSVRQAQPPLSLLLLPSLSSFFFSTKQKTPLESIKLFKAHNFNSFQLKLACTWEKMCEWSKLKNNKRLGWLREMNTSGDQWSTSILASKSKIDDANPFYSLRRHCRWRKEQQLWDESKQLNQGDEIGQMEKIWNLAFWTRIDNACSFHMPTRCCLSGGDCQLSDENMLLTKDWNRVIKL